MEGNENDFRSKLKCVLECDFHKSSPLDPENLGQFDAVISSLALESGCYEIITYKQAMKNVVSLLKPGGYLILYTSLNERFYSAGEMFEVLPLSSDDVKESLCEAGIDVLQIYENIYTDRTHNDGSIMIVGQKKY